MCKRVLISSFEWLSSYCKQFGEAIEAEFDAPGRTLPDPSEKISVFLAKSYFNNLLYGEAMSCFINRDEEQMCLVYKNDEDGYKIEHI